VVCGSFPVIYLNSTPNFRSFLLPTISFAHHLSHQSSAKPNTPLAAVLVIMHAAAAFIRRRLRVVQQHSRFYKR